MSRDSFKIAIWILASIKLLRSLVSVFVCADMRLCSCRCTEKLGHHGGEFYRIVALPEETLHECASCNSHYAHLSSGGEPVTATRLSPISCSSPTLRPCQKHVRRVPIHVIKMLQAWINHTWTADSFEALLLVP